MDSWNGAGGTPRWLEMSKLFPASIALVVLAALTSCEHMKSPGAKRAAAVPRTTSPLPPSASRPPFSRHDATVPFLTVRAPYADASAMCALIDAQDDHVVPFRGMRRAGDGIISVGVKDGRGRWLQSWECGGHIFITGASGQPCQIVLRNESNARLEIVAGIDGRDALNGGPFRVENAGIILPPLQTTVIGRVSRGKPAPLTFGAGRSPSAGPVVEREIKPAPGSILLAVFHERDRFPWEGSARPQPSATPDKFPRRKSQPAPFTHEYR